MRKNHFGLMLAVWCAVLFSMLACSGSGSSQIDPNVHFESPTITSQPQNVTVEAYHTATFTVTATNSQPIAYQWMKNGTAISEATAATYTTPITTVADSGSAYTVQLSSLGAAAVVSQQAILTVTPYSGTPIILTQPKSLFVALNASATFAVEAVGPSPITYQWKKDGVNITGATSSSFSIAKVGLSDGGSYTVQASNALGNTLSNVASLRVKSSSGGSFTATGDMNVARLYHTATLLNDGTVLVVGGSNLSQGPLNSAEIYVPNQKTFTLLTSSLRTPRYQHTATLLSDGTVLIAGGQTNSGATDTVELYNPSTQQFSVIGQMTTPRTQHTATLLNDGTVLLLGGVGPFSVLNTAEVFDPATGQSTLLSAPMNASRYGHATTVLSGTELLISGGYDASSIPSNQAETFNGTIFSATTGAMSTYRVYHTATRLPSGIVFIAGGQNEYGQPIGSGDLYHSSSDAFTGTVGILGEARYAHTATLLPDGTVLLAGGRGLLLEPLGNAEIYDPSSDSFRTLGDLVTARYGHTATDLGNGVILLTGGSNVSIGTLVSAELYQ